MKWLWPCLVVFCWLTQSAQSRQKLDQLLVHGKDFVFSVKEPPGWNGDTENAEKFQCNVVLHRAGRPVSRFAGLIRIRVNDKVDENTSADLEEDIGGYKAQFPKAQFKDLSVKHPQYLCLAKVFYVPGKFYEYVAYLNPGPKKPMLFSVSMSSEKSEASAEEIEAFKSAAQSLTLLKP